MTTMTAATAPETLTAYRVSECGPDQTIEAVDAESAAREVAEWQYGSDGRHVVTVEWTGTGPDTVIAEYRVSRLYDGRGEPEDCGRVWVRYA